MEAAKVGDVVAFEPPRAEWGLARRVGFRWLFAYLFFYLEPFPLDLIPVVKEGPAWWNARLNEAMLFFGRRILGLELLVEPSGSSDTTRGYVNVLFIALLATAVTLVWSLLDRRRDHYRTLFALFIVYVRFALAYQLLFYGAIKIWKSQFPMPVAARLMEPVGEMSPMGLLWTTLGHSTSYTIFAGLGEFVGSLLLFARRTSLLGALILVGVMSNVVMMNLSYDVCVKLYSLHLLAMAVLIAAPHAGRLLRFFVLGRDVPAVPAPGSPRVRAAAALFGLAVGATLTWQGVSQAIDSYRQYGDDAPQPAIAGVYDVVELTVDGQLVPATLAEGARLRRVGIDSLRFGVLSVDDHYERYGVTVDDKEKKLKLKELDPGLKPFELSYQTTDGGGLILDGPLGGKTIHATLRKVTPRYRLQTRGFNWIQEQSYNR